MLGSAVSSRTPRDFHPRSHMGISDLPLMKRHGPAGVAQGGLYPAVGIQSALDSAIGLPKRATSASRRLLFLTPAEVSSSFTRPFPELCRSDRSLQIPGQAVEQSGGSANAQRRRLRPV